MNIQTVQFVDYSDLMQDFPLIREGINSGDWSSITWGDANHTLISAERFQSELLDHLDCDTGEKMAEMEKVEAAVKGLPPGVYIDMES